MRLNHVTVTVTDIERAVEFYKRLGLEQIVASYPHYARFACPDGDSTFSLHGLGAGERLAPQSTSVHFECDDLDGKVAELSRRGSSSTPTRRTSPTCGARQLCAIPTGT